MATQEHSHNSMTTSGTAPIPTLATAHTTTHTATNEYEPEKKQIHSNIATSSLHSCSLEKQEEAIDHGNEVAAQDEENRHSFYMRYRPFILAAWALLIFGWWISSIMIKATRHRWIPSTVWAWFFILLIAFRFIPNRVVTRPIRAVWVPLIERPWYALSYRIRLALGVLALFALIFGSGFGFPLKDGGTYADRAISVCGLFVFQTCFLLASSDRRAIPWPTVIVGLMFQQIIALFVLKTKAGFDMFSWIAYLAADFLAQAYAGAAFFFSQDVVNQHWFFVNTLSCIIFFVAFVQMMYYLGVMQWLIKKFAWFFFKTMNVSGAEAVVAAASPWIGQGESACLVKPYVNVMTDSEIHLTMTSGFSTIAGSVLSAYIALGVPPQNLVTASVMSIPASISISKLRMPEREEPVTRGNVVLVREEENPPVNALQAFSQGALFGLVVAGQILAGVLTIIGLVTAIDGLLTWIGKGFSIPNLTLQLIFGYLFYPVVFLMGVPRNEILIVSRFVATKLVANEFVAYLALTAHQQATPLSARGFTIASYSLCGFANISSIGIQIGVLSALAPGRAKAIVRLAPSAMICGFLSTMQTAGIAGMLV
ncbi:hypothetical protein FRB96_001533 [Tulasnella sp. 330]|nr:hypothetical protein FRB96_001533 [Tulasnella sp. 330]KAG8890711.1 hypothetical protein FRB98_006215 [Tulasnella sp. 332]